MESGISLLLHAKTTSQAKLLRFAGGGCSLRVGGFGARVALADPRRLAAQLAQVVKLCAPYATALHYINVIDDGGVQRKDPLDADTEAGLADGNRFTRAAVLASYTHTFESLESFLCFRLFDPDMYPKRVAGLKVRNIRAQLYFFNTI